MNYRLNIRVDIQQVGPRGEYTASMGNNMQVTEEMLFEASNFAEIAKVLGQFHDLGEQLRQAAP